MVCDIVDNYMRDTMEKVDLLKKMRTFKDKNLYFECSEELKRDFDFITEVINIFKDDFDFIDDVAESYVKYIPEDDIDSNPEFIELCMLLGQYVPEGNQYYEFYTNRLNGIYSIFLLHVMMVKDEFPDVSELGFSILMDDHKGRTNILNYFAIRLMDELYHTNPCGSFEDLIHKHCDSAVAIMNEGYVNFFVRNLYGVDTALSYYVFDHPGLLDTLVNELDVICSNWDDYEQRLSDKCISVIREWVLRKETECSYGDDFDYEQAMNELIVSMNFAKMFGLDKKAVLSNKGKVLSFGSAAFKRDLKGIIDKVLFERLTITELDNLVLEDNEDPEKVLKK